MSTIRAITLIVADPSRSAAALQRVLGWEVEADFEAFASVTPPTGPPIWLNAPQDGQPVASGLVLHIATGDVDRSFDDAVSRGAGVPRTPQDMDFGERSASVTVDDVQGVTFDFSAPLDR